VAIVKRYVEATNRRDLDAYDDLVPRTSSCCPRAA
jgi:hypothetical protein